MLVFYLPIIHSLKGQPISNISGGLSYLSDLHGLVCDKVAKYEVRALDFRYDIALRLTLTEVVLANASIVEASADTNQDLFQALKGGSNNFGTASFFSSENLIFH